MTPQDITNTLQARFNDACDIQQPDTWQVDTPEQRLIVLLTNQQTWVRILIPIASLAEAQPFLAQILTANFEDTQMAHYATYENTLWGIFQHNLATVDVSDFLAAIEQLLKMKQAGVTPFFNSLTESRVRQLIQVAKLQGQSLEATMQTISRFYAEGIMGDMQDSQYGERALIAWKQQLERLWPDVNPPE